jgi:hypothetical protein
LCLVVQWQVLPIIDRLRRSQPLTLESPQDPELPQIQQESTGGKQGGDEEELHRRLNLKTFFDLHGGFLLNNMDRVDRGPQSLELCREILLSLTDRVDLSQKLRKLLRKIPDRGLGLNVGLDNTGCLRERPWDIR